MLALRAQKYRHSVSIQKAPSALKVAQAGAKRTETAQAGAKRTETARSGAKRADLFPNGARRALSWRQAHLYGAPARNETHRVANKAPRVANRAIGMAGRPAGPSQANANLKSNQISKSPQS